MKKVATICSCVLLVFVCTFVRENRAAGQGKTATQTKKMSPADAPLPQIDKEKFART